jgi:hypothetical protein
MLERMWHASMMYYLFDNEWVTMLLILVELTGFVSVIVAISRCLPVWLIFPVGLIFGGVWILSFEAICYWFISTYGYLKGVVPL